MSPHSTPRGITYIRHDGTSISKFVADLVDLYAVVYTEPPYQEGPEQVERFRASLIDDAKRAGFSMITARDGEQLAGAAYGWTMPAGNWWSRADKEAPPEILGADKLAVMEWIVHPRHRAKGIGAEIIRRLFQERQERYATLASDPRAPAREVYERAGWQQIAQTKLAWGPAMDLLVLNIARH